MVTENEVEQSMQEIDVGVDSESVDTDFPIAPAGTYRCVVTSVVRGTSQAQKPKITFGFTPTDVIVCKVGDKERPIGGKEIFKQSCSLQTNALFAIKGISNACGGEGYKGSRIVPLGFLQKQVMVTVSVGQKDGKTFNTITNVAKAD